VAQVPSGFRRMTTSAGQRSGSVARGIAHKRQDSLPEIARVPSKGEPRNGSLSRLPSARHIRREPRRLIVVQGQDAAIESNVDVGERVVLGVLDVASATNGPSARMLKGPWEELLIDGRVIERFQAVAPSAIERAHRIWISEPLQTQSGTRPNNDPFVNPLPKAGRAIKRLLDVVIAAATLLIVLPLLVLCGVLVRLDTPGPAVFHQIRVGENGGRFRMYKLRTMRAGGDDSLHRAYFNAMARGHASPNQGIFKLPQDPRVTRVGRLLRLLSLDELPQLWNVLRGDMSLVGPRPLLPEDLLVYDRLAWQRLRVKPGVTGLWQVSGRSRLSFREMVALDVAYWRSWSLGLELRILLRTPIAVLASWRRTA
jgi:lipopolysaccharide/colanic/teichoic acid biosynthesis glycosyltransferase